MTPQELLRPRYIVIADYPGCPYEVGQIIEPQAPIAARFLYENHPANFRPLNWWEHREEKDMPEYLLRNTKDRTVFKAVQHNIKATHGLFFVNEFGKLKSYCNYIPATEKDYNNQQKNRL